MTSENPSASSFVFQALFLALYLVGAVVSGVAIIHLPRSIGFIPATGVLFVAVSRLLVPAKGD